jgi:hypothetical protein
VAYGNFAFDITLFNNPEQMSTESAIVVEYAAADHSQKLNVGLQYVAGIRRHKPQLPVMTDSDASESFPIAAGGENCTGPRRQPKCTRQLRR